MEAFDPKDILALLASSQELHCVINHNAEMTWFGPNWMQILGWSEDLLHGVPLTQLIHANDVAPFQRRITQDLTRQTIGPPIEARFRHKDGSWRWLRWNMRPSATGGLCCTASDVSHEYQHKAQELKHASLLDAAERIARFGHWRIDIQQSHRPEWSSEIFRIYGLDPSQPPPLIEHVMDYYHPDDRERVARQVQEAIERRGGFDFEARLQGADGVERIITSRGMTEHDPHSGALVAVFGILQDITEHKRVQQRLIHSERMASLGSLAAGVAHEINNPLAYIIANLDFVLEELAQIGHQLDAEDLTGLREALMDAHEGTQRVQRIVKDLRNFSRAPRSASLNVDIHQVIDTAVQMTHNEVKHCARLQRDFGRVPHFKGSHQGLVQVFVNLLLNAAQALPDTRPSQNTITLRTCTDEHGRVVAEVSDTGPGIPEDIRDRIFEPFFTTKPIGVGTGLGLSVCHGIVSAHGGELQVEERPGGGTVIRVSLPAAPNTSNDLPDTPTTSQHFRHRGRILLIDGKESITQIVERVMNHQRFLVTTTTQGDEALAEIRTQNVPFDLVLCDLNMPDMSGTEFLERLRQESPPLLQRVVFITGPNPSASQAAFLDAAPHPHLTKPFGFAALCDLLDRMIGQDTNP